MEATDRVTLVATFEASCGGYLTIRVMGLPFERCGTAVHLKSGAVANQLIYAANEVAAIDEIVAAARGLTQLLQTSDLRLTLAPSRESAPPQRARSVRRAACLNTRR